MTAPKFKKFITGLLLTCSAFILVVFTIYSMAWYTFTKRAEIYLDALWSDKADFTISGERPRLRGYPFVPTSTFSGEVEHLASGTKIVTPQLIFSGFPAPQQTLTLNAPQGIRIASNFLERELNFDYAYLQFKSPTLPSSNAYEDISAWQKKGRTFIIEQIILKSGKIYARGEGTLSLDDNLQLSGNITARVVGMDVLFDDLAAEKGERTIAIARNFFNMMSQVDEKTGEKYFETSLKIQNRGLYFGPMRISGLPEIKWKQAQPQALPAQ